MTTSEVWASIGKTSGIGILTVFAALAIIYLALRIMEIFFVKKVKLIVTAPQDGEVAELLFDKTAQKNAPALILASDGVRGEIASPAKGKIKYAVKAGAKVSAGAELFTVEEGK